MYKANQGNSQIYNRYRFLIPQQSTTHSNSK